MNYFPYSLYQLNRRQNTMHEKKTHTEQKNNKKPTQQVPRSYRNTHWCVMIAPDYVGSSISYIFYFDFF